MNTPKQRKRSIPFDANLNPVWSRAVPVFTEETSKDTVTKRLAKLFSCLKVVKKSSIAWRILYLLCFSLCFIEASYQVVTLLDIYFRYPLTVSVSVETKPNLTLPGITFCSSIGVRKSGLEKMDDFVAIQELSEKTSANKSASEKQTVLDYFYYSFLEKTPLDQLIVNSVNFSEFIVVKQTKCALDEVLQVKLLNNETSVQNLNKLTCKKQIEKEFIESFQGTQICWTLFHASKWSNLTRIKVPSGHTQSAVFLREASKQTRMSTNDETAEDSSSSEDETMHPLEIIRFVINFTQSESVKLDKPAVGTVSVHDPDEIRMGRLESHDLLPGRFYEIFLEETVSHLLEFPYESDCYPYLEKNQRFYDEVSEDTLPPHPVFAKPLSSSDCTYGCLGHETVKRCGCWSPELPFVNSLNYEQVDLEIINSSLTLCDWIKRGQKWKNQTLPEKTRAMIEFYTCFSSEDIVSKCEFRCKRECVKTRIKSSYQHRVWPSDERIKCATPKQAVILNEFRNCCSVVSVRMSSNEITKFTYSAKYEAVEFISYIGGIVSLWMGFTFIGIFDYFKAVVKFACKKKKLEVNTRKEREENDAEETEEPESYPWYMNYENRRSSRVGPLITVSAAPTRRNRLDDPWTNVNHVDLNTYRKTIIYDRNRAASSFS